MLKQKTKERAAVAAVTTVAAAGVLVGSAFATPADLLQPDEAAQNAVTATVDGGDDGGAAGGDQETDKTRRGGIRGRMRQWMLQLPLAVRACVGVPLWGLGWALITGLSFLLTGAVSPAVGTALTFLALAAVLLLSLAGAAKAMFPDIPLRKLLSIKNFFGVCMGVGLLGAVHTAAPLVWPGYEAAADAVRVGGSLTVLLLACIACGRRQSKRRMEDAAMPPEDGRTEVERKAMALADTVCPPRY